MMADEMDNSSKKSEGSLQTIEISLELPHTNSATVEEEEDSAMGEAHPLAVVKTDNGGATNETGVSAVETNPSDQLQSSDENKWKSVPILPVAITVTEEVEDGTSVPTKLLIYPGNIAAESDQVVEEVTGITNNDASITNKNTENEETEDCVPNILFHLIQQDTGQPGNSKELSTLPDPGDKDSQFSCNLCDFVSKHLHNLKTHMLVHKKPTIKEYFKCEECDYITPLKHNLKTHMKKHAKLQDLSENDIFRCKECDYVSAYKHDLQTHVMKHATVKPHQCEECDFSSIYKHSLIHHVASKHEKQRPYKCTECSYSSARKQDLQVHMGKHSTEKPFQCQLCDYGTPFRQSFKAHMNRHLGHKTFKCNQPDCDFATTTQQNLKSHLARHNTVKQHQCQYCDYSASHKIQLANHEAKHTDNNKIKTAKKYSCSSCDYETSHKYSMKRHEERHSENRTMPEKVFHCGQCGYQTGYKSSLKRHVAKHSDVKPFRCGHCEYSAVNMTQMHVHIAKHTGIKPFKCNQCEYSTANKQHLVGHMSKHSNVKLKCPLCDFTTAWRQRLRIHIKQHEKAAALNVPRHMLQHHQSMARNQGQLVETQQQGVSPDEESVQHLYHFEQSETNEALSQLSNVIAAYQEQVQDSSGSGSQTPSEGTGEQPSSDIHMTEIREDQVLLIPNMDIAQTQVVIVDGDQMHPQAQEQLQFIIDGHNKPVLKSAVQKIVSTHPKATTSTEIEIDVTGLHSQVISAEVEHPLVAGSEQTLIADGEQHTIIADGEQTIIADGVQTLMVEGEQTLVANEKSDFQEQNIEMSTDSMEIETSEVVTGGAVATEQVLESIDHEQTLTTSIEISNNEIPEVASTTSVTES